MVVGGGPVGCRTAYLLRKQGFDCAVIEEHPSIGEPVSCSGLISRSGVESLGLKLGEGVLVNGVKGAKIHSRTQTIVVEKPSTVAYVIDRAKFDRQIAREAVSAGVDVFLNTKLLNIRGDKAFIERNGKGELLKSEFFAGCDGASSKARELVGVKTSISDFVKCYQVRAKGSFDSNFVEMFFDNYAENFFAWIIPESKDIARIGIGTSSPNAKLAFDSFVSNKNLDFEPPISTQSGIIPMGEPIKNPVSGNLLLVGDAAFQTKSTTGGGIITGFEGASFAANAVANHYKHKKNISEYQKMLSPLNRELDIHWKIRKYLNNLLASGKIDNFFYKAKKAGIEDFLSLEGDMDKPSSFMGKIWFKPSLWGLLPDFLRL